MWPNRNGQEGQESSSGCPSTGASDMAPAMVAAVTPSSHVPLASAVLNRSF
jgi:hypothetical protein